MKAILWQRHGARLGPALARQAIDAIAALGPDKSA